MVIASLLNRSAAGSTDHVLRVLFLINFFIRMTFIGLSERLLSAINTISETIITE